ncbi:glycosyltransferase [Leeuwenhoekiella sp. LLG6367-2.1]|uniref:glycosyltransferase n=1 Tax=Leeuwenhoekiella sp. LLG6367-2.1 TaxID=3160833 RepID=UPI0038648A16
MRVLQLIDSLEVGGAERMAVNYANALLNEIEVSALCTTRSEGDLKNLLQPDIPYLFLNKKHTLDLFAFLRLRRFVKNHNIQIIQAHGSSYFTAVFLKIITPALKVVWHDHYGNSEYLKERNTTFLKPLSRYFDAVISVNDILSRWSNEYLNIEKHIFLKNFIADALPLNQDFNPKGIKGKRLVCVANLRPQKNHMLLLRAFEEVLKMDDEYTLHLFGSKIDPVYSQMILSNFKAPHFYEKVFYYGTHLKLSAVLPYFDIGVLASHSEGLPLALLEYGQAGLAVVATDVGDCAKVLDGCGQVIQPGNIDSLVAAILKYAEEPELRLKYATLLKERVNNEYSDQAQVKQLLYLYEHVIH